MLPIVAAIGASVGSAAEKNAANIQASAGQQPTSNPTSDFIQASRRASLERQQQAGMQQQLNPTALQGAGLGAAQPAQPAMQGAGMAPAAGMLTRGMPDPAVIAAMFGGR